jgi:predicted PurR-regulated permease PerM
MEPVIAGGPQSPAPRTKAAFAIAIAFAVVLLVYWVRSALFVTFLGLCVAILVSRMADLGHQYLRVPRGLAATVATVLLFLVGAGLVALLAFPVIEQLGKLVDELPRYAEAAQRRFNYFRADHPEFSALLPAEPLGQDGLGGIAGKAGNVAWGAVTAVMGLFEGFVTLVTIFFLALFFALEPERYVSGAARLWPGPNEPQLDVMYKIGAALRAWMVATGIDIAVVAVLWSIGLWLIGIDYFLLFGLIGGFCQIVPYYGPIAAFIPPLLISLAIGP